MLSPVYIDNNHHIAQPKDRAKTAPRLQSQQLNTLKLEVDQIGLYYWHAGVRSASAPMGASSAGPAGDHSCCRAAGRDWQPSIHCKVLMHCSLAAFFNRCGLFAVSLQGHQGRAVWHRSKSVISTDTMMVGCGCRRTLLGSALCPDGCEEGGCVQDATKGGLRCQKCRGTLLQSTVRVAPVRRIRKSHWQGGGPLLVHAPYNFLEALACVRSSENVPDYR